MQWGRQWRYKCCICTKYLSTQFPGENPSCATCQVNYRHVRDDLYRLVIIYVVRPAD